MTGETPDISEDLDSAFYDWCWYNYNAGLGENKLGKCLSLSHHVDSLMSYWVLTENGTVVSRATLSRFANLEAQTYDNKLRVAACFKLIQ